MLLAAGAVGLWWLTDRGLAGSLGTGPGPGVPGAAVADVPAGYARLYRAAAGTCPGLDWALLAGVGKVETDHGRLAAPGVRSGTNFAGAAGPMQFLGPTWREVRREHPEVGADVYDPADAIPGAAHYLCDQGLRDGRGVRAALWGYNRSTAYADMVLAHAQRYRAAAADAAAGPARATGVAS